MKNKRNRIQIILQLFFLIILVTCIFFGCSHPEENKNSLSEKESVRAELIVRGDGIEKDILVNLTELAKEKTNSFEGIYSSINNWPSIKFYAAKGIKLEGILRFAGVYDSFQSITFRSEDGYECTLTRNQILMDRYYYPNIEIEKEEQAEKNSMIIATSLIEDTKEGSALKESKTITQHLIFGQSDISEHTNPAFVENVKEIIVSDTAVEKWEMASTFPAEGFIEAGEKVKLQYENMGVVKLHYTLDGTNPTERSPLYNPSTYQPELNIPITVNQDTMVKILVVGYGKENSEIATYQFIVKGRNNDDI